MQNYLFVFLGGMLGSLLRFLVLSVASSYTFLWVVNLIGSLLLGCLNGFYSKSSNLRWKLFFTTGMLGAFTTFSSFSEIWFRILKEDIMIGILYGSSMTISCFIVALVGFYFFQGRRQ